LDEPALDFRPGYSFSDPSELAAASLASDGLSVIEALRDGRLPPPPIAVTMDFTILEAEKGRVVFGATPARWQFNPIGSIHGGVLSTLLDSAAGCAVQTILPAGRAYTSLDLSVKFLRTVTMETGPITALGTVVTSGRRTALAEARITDAKGRLLAQATSTCLLFDVPG
jgi:uncharacterized protein (TIGR00369 family)